MNNKNSKNTSIKFLTKRKELCIVTGNSNFELAKEIANYLKLPLGDLIVSKFSDGESRVIIHESMRGKDVFVIQSICQPVNDNLVELLIMIDALKRASARIIAVVIPYYGYARQDKKVQPREPITAKLIANLLTTAGAQRILAMDLHAASIQGFFDIPVDHLTSIPTICHYFKSNRIGGKDTVIVSPDVGGVVRARTLAEKLNSSLAIISKRRRQVNEAEVMEIIGSVKGLKAVMVDDIVDTAGTLVKGADALINIGAREVTAFCTHAVLSGDAVEKVENSGLNSLIVTDTIPLTNEKTTDKIKVVSVAKVFGEAIKRGFRELSISELFC